MARMVSAEPDRATAPDGSFDGARAIDGLGSEIRQIRRSRGMSASALARQIGVSPSLISQVERGITSPSIEVMWAIARSLETPMGTFFQQAPSLSQDRGLSPATSKATIVRAGSRKRLALPNSVSYELLSPDLKRQIEFTWTVFEPGDESPHEPYSHIGEEQMVVIEGEIHFWIDGVEIVLEEGDALTIDSSLPHRAANRSDRRAIVVAAMTPPSF